MFASTKFALSNTRRLFHVSTCIWWNHLQYYSILPSRRLPLMILSPVRGRVTWYGKKGIFDMAKREPCRKAHSMSQPVCCLPKKVGQIENIHWQNTRTVVGEQRGCVINSCSWSSTRLWPIRGGGENSPAGSLKWGNGWDKVILDEIGDKILQWFQ